MRPVFEALRIEIRALDPCVVEECLKYYIAYKAETNFIDIVPRQKRLRLVLNIAYHELSDHKHLATDISHQSHTGNGDTGLNLTTTEDIPYVMGLIRQAFDKQMGNQADG